VLLGRPGRHRRLLPGMRLACECALHGGFHTILGFLSVGGPGQWRCCTVCDWLPAMLAYFLGLVFPACSYDAHTTYGPVLKSHGWSKRPSCSCFQVPPPARLCLACSCMKLDFLPGIGRLSSDTQRGPLLCKNWTTCVAADFAPFTALASCTWPVPTYDFAGQTCKPHPC